MAEIQRTYDDGIYCSSLTFEGVRRLLEKDLGLETSTLDGHKQLIKKLLQEVPFLTPYHMTFDS